MQVKTTISFKQRGSRIWISCLGILLGLPLLFYFGYCGGLWGRQSLLFQYLFQCNCPSSSEEARYPESVDVIVSACRNGGVRISPSGRLLFVNNKINADRSTYLLDLETKSESPISLPDGELYFLNDELIYIFVWYGRGNEGGEHIFDRTTNTMFPIQRFAYAYPGSYINGDADLVKLATALRGTKDVYYIDNYTDTVIALAADFHHHPEHNFFIDTFDIPSERGLHRVEPFLNENEITYRLTPAHFPGEAVSPDKRFIARHDGIYLLATGEKIEDGYFVRKFFNRQYFSVRGWMYDSSGVIYSKFLDPCLIGLGFDIEYYTCFLEVAQPVIEIKVPEEYLSSHGTE